MRTFVILVLIIAVGAGIGYYFGWLGFSADREPGKMEVGVQVNTDKIKADAQAAEEKARRVGDRFKGGVEEAEHADSAQGTVTSVDEPNRRLLLSTTGNKELVIQVDSRTTIRFRDTPTKLNELRAGDQVSVVFEKKDGKNLAQSITLERNR